MGDIFIQLTQSVERLLFKPTKICSCRGLDVPVEFTHSQPSFLESHEANVVTFQKNKWTEPLSTLLLLWYRTT